MPFLIRPSRHFPVCCPITYHCGDFEGHGIAWNVSLTGWRFSGNLPLLLGDVCSLTVNLPNEKTLYVLTQRRSSWKPCETLTLKREGRFSQSVPVTAGSPRPPPLDQPGCPGRESGRSYSNNAAGFLGARY